MPWTAMLQTAVVVLLVAAMTLVRSIDQNQASRPWYATTGANRRLDHFDHLCGVSDRDTGGWRSRQAGCWPHRS